MTWFRVDDGFHSHPKVLAIPRGAARLRAVGLWTALGSWCAKHLTDGEFAKHMVAEHGGTAAEVRHLVAVNLWEPTETGYRFVDWDGWNPTRETVEADRAAARERMRANRSKNKPERSPGVRANVRANSDRTSPPVRLPLPDPSLAAAAATRATPPLPPPIEILRARLIAANPKFADVRWDTLDPHQLDDITTLIDTHGDATLTRAAVTAWRPDAPAAFAQAWLGLWRALPTPGTGLQAVANPCEQPGHSGTTRHCAQCASEAKAAN